MDALKQRFYAIPQAEEVEAPTSWLVRSAASQGERVESFAEMLGFDGGSNFERQFVLSAPRHIAKVCGLPPYSFDLAFRLLDQAFKLELSYPMLLTHSGKARFRFCPVCLKQQRTPFFPVHWRFDAWRMCYEHKCLMEDVCPHCSNFIYDPSCMMRKRTIKTGCSFVSQCPHCCKLLWKTTPLYLDSVDGRIISAKSRIQLSNGNAFLSALVHEVLFIPEMAPLAVKTGLAIARSRGLLPDSSCMTADDVRRLKKGPARSTGSRKERAEQIANWFDAGHQGEFQYKPRC